MQRRSSRVSLPDSWPPLKKFMSRPCQGETISYKMNTSSIKGSDCGVWLIVLTEASFSGRGGWPVYFVAYFDFGSGLFPIAGLLAVPQGCRPNLRWIINLRKGRA